MNSFSDLPEDVKDLCTRYNEWLRMQFFPLMHDAEFPTTEEVSPLLKRRYTVEEFRAGLQARGPLEEFSDEQIIAECKRDHLASPWCQLDNKTSWSIAGGRVWTRRIVYEGSTERQYRGEPNFCIYREQFYVRCGPLVSEARDILWEFVRLNADLAVAPIPWPHEHHNRKLCSPKLLELLSA